MSRFYVVDFDNDPNYEDNHNFGWTFVTEATSHREALVTARAFAETASLLPSDITPDCIRPATQADIDEYIAMGGSLT